MWMPHVTRIYVSRHTHVCLKSHAKMPHVTHSHHSHLSALMSHICLTRLQSCQVLVRPIQYVGHDSSIHMRLLSSAQRVWDMGHGHIHIRITHLHSCQGRVIPSQYVRHDSFIYGEWLIHIDATLTSAWRVWIWDIGTYTFVSLICIPVKDYGVDTISRLLKMIGLVCKRALWKRRYSAKETYHFKEPTKRSHPIVIPSQYYCVCVCVCLSVLRIYCLHSIVHVSHDSFYERGMTLYMKEAYKKSSLFHIRSHASFIWRVMHLS